MKQWTVYYRDKNGSKASVVIEAEDRVGVFAELKKRGISAISVSEGASNKKPRKAASSGAPSKGRGLIAAVIVVLVAGIAAWWMMKGEEKVVEEKKEVKVDKKPALSRPQKKVEQEKVPHIEIREIEGGRLQKFVNGKPRWAYPRQKPTKVVATNNMEHLQSRESRIFKNSADAMIASLLNTELGEPLVGDSESFFGRGFMKAFKKSLEEPFEIGTDDSEDVKDLKRAVAETKAELVARMNKGEDVCKELAAARDELVTLGLYRQELENMVKETARNDKSLTPEDINDLVSAANKMLEELGAASLTMPNFLVRRARVWSLKHKEGQK